MEAIASRSVSGVDREGDRDPANLLARIFSAEELRGAAEEDQDLGYIVREALEEQEKLATER